MSHGYSRLNELIPRKRQVLRAFLSEAINEIPHGPSNSFETDIGHIRFQAGVSVLLDERHDHNRCRKLLEPTCSQLKISSRNLSIGGMYQSLHQSVSPGPCIEFSIILHTEYYSVKV